MFPLIEVVTIINETAKKKYLAPYRRRYTSIYKNNNTFNITTVNRNYINYFQIFIF